MFESIGAGASGFSAVSRTAPTYTAGSFAWPVVTPAAEQHPPPPPRKRQRNTNHLTNSSSRNHHITTTTTTSSKSSHRTTSSRSSQRTSGRSNSGRRRRRKSKSRSRGSSSSSSGSHSSEPSEPQRRRRRDDSSHLPDDGFVMERVRFVGSSGTAWGGTWGGDDAHPTTAGGGSSSSLSSTWPFTASAAPFQQQHPPPGATTTTTPAVSDEERHSLVYRYMQRERAKDAQEALRLQHLLYNPDLPHLLSDPLRDVAGGPAVAAVAQQQQPPVVPYVMPPPRAASQPPTHKTTMVVLDTSVLLQHGDPFAMLDCLVDAGHVLLVPFTVLGELDFRMKEGNRVQDRQGGTAAEAGDHRTTRAGDLARQVRDWLTQMLATSEAAGLPCVVHLQSQREVDPVRMRLASNNDDRILACASYFRQHVASADVVLATNDLNLALRAKADRFAVLSSNDIVPPAEGNRRWNFRQPKRRV